MLRDVDQLTKRTFDVLVVGGGVYGLAIAYDAAQRGFRCALIEADDFGSGSSFNHLRTIHGGLRYLQTLDLGRARESVRERRTLARIAPHGVRPLVFALPLARSLTQGKLAMRAGFLLDRLVSIDRNRGVTPSHRLPGGCVISRETAGRRFPALPQQGLTGAAVWCDYETVEADRLTFAWALAATEHGAVLANHVEATAPIVEAVRGRRVVGVRARDRQSGGELEIAAQVIINATGAGVDRLLQPLGLALGMPLLKAMNLVTRRDGGEHALGGRAASGRHLFQVPWRGRALFGTWESEHACAPDATAAGETDVMSFIAQLNQAFPSLDLKMDDVTLVHRGLVPAVAAANGRVSLQGHEQVRDHASDGVEGLMSAVGTKYTTARAVAERVTDRLAGKLRRAAVPCRTASIPLPGGDLADVGLAIGHAQHEHAGAVAADTLAHLVAAYGSRYRNVLALSSADPEWLQPLAVTAPVIGAQVVWAVRQEMAVTMCDAVVRRTPLGALGHPGDAAAERAARLLGRELRWSDQRVQEELVALRRFYTIGSG